MGVQIPRAQSSTYHVRRFVSSFTDETHLISSASWPMPLQVCLAHEHLYPQLSPWYLGGTHVQIDG